MNKDDISIVYVDKIPMCQACDGEFASYYAYTPKGNGVKYYLCKNCFRVWGVKEDAVVLRLRNKT